MIQGRFVDDGAPATARLTSPVLAAAKLKRVFES